MKDERGKGERRRGGKDFRAVLDALLSTSKASSTTLYYIERSPGASWDGQGTARIHVPRAWVDLNRLARAPGSSRVAILAGSRGLVA